MAMEDDERFAATLDECCRRLQRGEPIAACLADYPAEYRAELARLAPLAAQVGELRRDPSPQFQTSLEQRLLAAVERQRTARQAPNGWLGRLLPAALATRVALLAAAALIILAGSGVGIAAAEDSLPDSPLYSVKTAREWVALALAFNGETRVSVHATQVAQRGRELALAIRADKPRPVLETLVRRLGNSIDRMVAQALELQAQGRREPALRALAAIRIMEREVDRLAQQASPEVRPALARVNTFLQEQQARLLAGRAPVR